MLRRLLLSRSKAPKGQLGGKESMELPAVLASMAEGSITLAGFAAVFRAFGGAEDPDGHSRIRLNIVIEGGLVVAFLCYFPAWLSSAGFSSDAVWRSGSAIGALWVLFRMMIISFRILRSGAPLPVLYPVAVPIGVVSFLALVANTAGLLPVTSYSGHLLGTVSLLTTVGVIFIAQFRAELR